jgi:predicted nucleotidyltransferase
MPSPTPYPDVNAVLDQILAGARAVLNERLLAMYVDGSLALGDFDHASSDIDFLIVADGDITSEELAELHDTHEHIAATTDARWSRDIEGSYLPLDVLRRYDPARIWFPRIQRGPDERLRMEEHPADWVVHRYVLREHGIPIVGPPPASLIDPVKPDDLRRAMIELMRHEWWRGMLIDPTPLAQRGYWIYTVQTMCRVLYTLKHGAVTSKPAAARWAAADPACQWHAIIERAFASPVDAPDDIEGVQSLMRFTMERCEECAIGHTESMEGIEAPS